MSFRRVRSLQQNYQSNFTTIFRFRGTISFLSLFRTIYSLRGYPRRGSSRVVRGTIAPRDRSRLIVRFIFPSTNFVSNTSRVNFVHLYQTGANRIIFTFRFFSNLLRVLRVGTMEVIHHMRSFRKVQRTVGVSPMGVFFP